MNFLAITLQRAEVSAASEEHQEEGWGPNKRKRRSVSVGDRPPTPMRAPPGDRPDRHEASFAHRASWVIH